jgi:hemerythrin
MKLTEIHWDKDWELGVFYIDEQHKRLVNIVNKIAKSQVHDVYIFLSELIQYSSDHFTDEEQLMISVEFPNLMLHKQEHRLFNRALLEYSFRLNNGEDKNILHEELSEFVAKWFAYHFLKTDRLLVEFIKEEHSIEKLNKRLNK